MFTTGELDASRFAAEALKNGVKRIISIGGDGTLNEVVHGIMQRSTSNTTDIELALIPVGTGNDWTRMYGIPLDYKGSI